MRFVHLVAALPAFALLPACALTPPAPGPAPAGERVIPEEAVVPGQAGVPTRFTITVIPLAHSTQERTRAGEAALEEGEMVLQESSSEANWPAMGAVEVGFANGLSLEVMATTQLRAYTDSYDRFTLLRHFTQTSSVLGGTLGYQLGPVRIGAGPAVQITYLNSSLGECRCEDVDRQQRYIRGAVVQAAGRLPLGRTLSAELRVQRYIFDDEPFEPLRGDPEYPARRPVWFVGAGGSVRLGR